MADLYEWYDTNGGPHLLVQEEFLPSWRGIEGWSPETHGVDDSDYSRACAVSGWLGSVPCGNGHATVLGGDVGAIAWIEVENLDGGFLVQWLGIDDEAEIHAALLSTDLTERFNANTAESMNLELGACQTLRLLDSSDVGRDIRLPSRQIKLRSTRYRISAAFFETPTLIMVVRKLERS